VFTVLYFPASLLTVGLLWTCVWTCTSATEHCVSEKPGLLWFSGITWTKTALISIILGTRLCLVLNWIKNNVQNLCSRSWHHYTAANGEQLILSETSVVKKQSVCSNNVHYHNSQHLSKFCPVSPESLLSLVYLPCRPYLPVTASAFPSQVFALRCHKSCRLINSVIVQMLGGKNSGEFHWRTCALSRCNDSWRVSKLFTHSQ